MIGLVLRARDRSYVAVYSVYEPPNPPADRIDRAEGMVFVKDGFTWSAALLPPLWLAAQRGWIGLGIYLAAATVLAGALWALGVHAEWITLAVLALNVLIGFEASGLQRWALELAGWNEAGTVSGRSRAECERRFFDILLAGVPAVAGSGGPDGSSGISVDRGRDESARLPLLGRLWRGAHA